jgi:DNA-binding response OmpR family regulator
VNLNIQKGYNLLMARKILVVDDTRNVQVMLEDFLTGQDFLVITASDGREALQALQTEKPDLILLDIMMPNMDGELLVRIRAVLRRAPPQEGGEDRLVIGDISLDRGRHQVRRDGSLVELTPLEFHILETLMLSAGRVVRRADFSIQLMEQGFSGSESTTKIHIRNLRLKLGDDLNQPRYIETVFGVGYRFKVEE